MQLWRLKQKVERIEKKKMRIILFMEVEG